MSRFQRDRRPNAPEVQRLDLKEGNYVKRIILFACALAVGAAAFAYALNTMLTPKKGWQMIEVTTKTSAAQEVILEYNFDQAEDVAQEKKRVTAIYSEALQSAAAQLDWVETEGTVNLHTISSQPNTPVTVGKELYEALESWEKTGSRSLYFAPLYSRYNALFACENDQDAALYDPDRNPEAGAFVEALMTYLSSDSHSRLELLGDNRVELYVSEEYLDFARENEIPELLDFGWAKNAFVVDAVAQTLLDQGADHGVFFTIEGFSRCLYEVPVAVHLMVPAVTGGEKIANGIYTGPKSLAILCGFPVSEGETRFYTYEDGTVLGPYIDEATGHLKTGSDNLVVFDDGPAGPTAVKALNAMAAGKAPEGKCMYSRGNAVICTDPDVRISWLHDDYALQRK